MARPTVGSRGWTIRRALPADAEELTRLARSAKASLGYPVDWLDAWRDELTDTADYVTQNQAFVIRSTEARWLWSFSPLASATGLASGSSG